MIQMKFKFNIKKFKVYNMQEIIVIGGLAGREAAL